MPMGTALDAMTYEFNRPLDWYDLVLVNGGTT